MKKILVLINSLDMGGAEKVVVTLAKEYVNNGIQVILVCLESSKFYDLDDGIEVVSLSNFTGCENNFLKLLFLPVYAVRLYRLARKKSITSIQSHLFRANIVNMLVKLFYPTCNAQIVNHGIAGRYREQGIAGIVNLFLLKHLYRFADTMISVSRVMNDEMQQLFNFENDTRIIPNPFDIDEIITKAKKDETEFTFDDGKKYLISAGRLIKLKRNRDILQALSKLPSDFELILLGEGDERLNLIALAEELNVRDRVHFQGRVVNPFSYFSRSYIFVLASEIESFSNVLVEAMICRLPIITADFEGAGERLNPDTENASVRIQNPTIEKCGIIVPIADVDALVNAVQLLDADDKLRDDLTERAFERAQDFSAEKISKQYIELI